MLSSYHVQFTCTNEDCVGIGWSIEGLCWVGIDMAGLWLLIVEETKWHEDNYLKQVLSFRGGINYIWLVRN